MCMKITLFALPCLIALISIDSCASTVFPSFAYDGSRNEDSFNETSYSYEDVASFFIPFEEIFLIDKLTYYIYFYASWCPVCNEIKDRVIAYALQHQNIYFLNEPRGIKYAENISSTIGISSLDNLYIVGYPSLIKINNKTIEKNLAGDILILNELNI